jgi:two-component system, LytTR family, sensor kinase
MKSKLYRHLFFWLVTCVQGTLFEYAWIHSSFSNEPQTNIVAQALVFNFIFIPSKLFFTYYTLNIVAKEPFKSYHNSWLILLKLGIALFIAILLHRIGTAYYIIPHEYPLHKPYTWTEIFKLPWMFVSLLDIGYVAGIAAALKLFRMQAISSQNEKELVKQKLETELKYLKNQINPHFLFNTLNSIYVLARKKSDETQEVVLKLANLLRFMLYESACKAIRIIKEIKILEDYVQLEKMRYIKPLDICFCQEIDDYDQLISPLILLPFVENAFKHGTNDTIDAKNISINAKLNQGHLTFIVKNSHNNGCKGPIKENIGLKNVRRQLELTYSDFSLNINNLEQTFVVDLKINLNNNGKL